STLRQFDSATSAFSRGWQSRTAATCSQNTRAAVTLIPDQQPPQESNPDRLFWRESCYALHQGAVPLLPMKGHRLQWTAGELNPDFRYATPVSFPVGRAA